ncbi:MAG: class I SAM-dependent methyltransferase [bacterium]
MTTLQEFKRFYQDNPLYFEDAEKGIISGEISLSHRHIHAYVRTLRGKIICDFGCGTGRDIEQMYNSDNRYVGLDVSVGALKSAEKHFLPANVSYTQIDFEKLVPLPDASFDVITSFYVFEHVLRPTQTLDEMSRLLTRGGELFIITPNYGSPLKSAPPLGTPSKIKLIRKTIKVFKTMVRRTLLPHSGLDDTMIPLNKLDLSSTWGSDMDATNEPWSWEIASYLVSHGFRVSVTSWEAFDKKDLKTGPERMLWPLRKLPFIRHLGELCVVHATKI